MWVGFHFKVYVDHRLECGWIMKAHFRKGCLYFPMCSIYWEFGYAWWDQPLSTLVCSCAIELMMWVIAHPNTLTCAGHQQTESTNIGCNQWLSLAKSTLKWPLLVGIVQWWPAPVSVGGLWCALNNHINVQCIHPTWQQCERLWGSNSRENQNGGKI